MRIETEEQAKAVSEYIKSMEICHQQALAVKDMFCPDGAVAALPSQYEPLKAALAEFESRSEEREFEKIKLSDVALKRLALICVMKANAEGHDELFKHGLEESLHGPTKLAPTDKGRRFYDWLRAQEANPARELKWEVWCAGNGEPRFLGAFDDKHEANIFMERRKELADRRYIFELREVQS